MHSKNSTEIKIDSSWKELLQEIFESSNFQHLKNIVRTEYQNKVIYPSGQDIFRAFDATPVQDVKVIILGQDPYHTPGVADGLAFSTVNTNKVPPSLINIYKEIIEEYYSGSRNSYKYYSNPDLTRWATQGVLLLNSSLTVESGKANSHANIGWQEFTDSVIHILSKKHKNLVFILWGSFARKKKILIENISEHLVLESAHPSPLSAHNGFFGNNHFKLCNEYLKLHNKTEIEW